MTIENVKNGIQRELDEVLVKKLVEQTSLANCYYRAKSDSRKFDVEKWDMSNAQLSEFETLAYQADRVNELTDEKEKKEERSKEGEYVKRRRRLEKAKSNTGCIDTILKSIQELKGDAQKAARNIREHLHNPPGDLEEEIYLSLTRSYVSALVKQRKVIKSKRGGTE